MSIFSKFKSALSNTSKKLSVITDLFNKKQISSASLMEFEEILLLSDFGVKTTHNIIDKLKSYKFTKDSDAKEYNAALKTILVDILLSAYKPFQLKNTKLNIILFCGVNGNGKTTSIGKLAFLLKNQYNKKVAIAACDTFRAAAPEQLEFWSNKAGAIIIKGVENQDPASVAYKAVQESISSYIDVLIIDTAGRLPNQQNLMDELTKLINVIKKIDPTAPHEVIMTLDASTGQNSFNQLEKFNQAANISGIIFTKLDGTAKGGSIIGLTNEYKLPIYYITLGEKIDDIVSFSPEDYIKSILE